MTTSTAQPDTAPRTATPYPFCPATGWLVSRGGWVRLYADVAVTLNHLSGWHLRQLMTAKGIHPKRCNWRGEILDCLTYGEAVRLVETAQAERRCRSP